MLLVSLQINGTEYPFAGISGNRGVLLRSDFTIYLGEDFKEFGSVVHIVSPLKTVFGIDVWAMRTEKNVTETQTGGAIYKYDKENDLIRFNDVSFSVWENQYTFVWKYEITESECIITDDTVLTVRDFDDERDILVTKDEFFHLLEQGYLNWGDDATEEILPCFIGIDVKGNALYVGEVPVFDPAC